MFDPLIQATEKARRLGVDISAGKRMGWVTVDSHARPPRIEPYLEGIRFDHRPDYNYYAGRLARRFLEVLRAVPAV